ncbi:MAG: hypothetical protein WBV68_08770 [Exiguobacterium oxidotolerans]
MSKERNDNVTVALNSVGVETQLELFRNDLQSRIRAIMAIYGVNRSEAEKISEEIYDDLLGK